MENMNVPDICAYLLKGKEILKRLNTYKYVYIVSGNESCDLDSAVSSLVYGYFLHRKHGPDEAVLSILNIPIQEFALKTELVYHLKICGIDISHIIFRSDIDLRKLHTNGKLKLILVDHHTLTSDDEYLRSSVVEVIDHRPQDPAWTWENIKTNLQTVGSCCTIITEILLDTDETCITQEIGALLYGPIVLDTACLSQDAGIATNQDQLVASRLENICKLDRKTIFRDLLTLKTTIFNMTPKQVLTKDLKITCGIPIFGLPISVKGFLKPEGAQKAVKSFCKDIEAPVAVIMGLTINDDVVQRDLAVYSDLPEVSRYAHQLVRELKTCEEPKLDLRQVWVAGIKRHFILFDIGVQASRKKILPIIRKFAQQHSSPSNCLRST